MPPQTTPCRPSQISKAVVRGNLASYSLFLLFGSMALANAIVDLPNQKKRSKDLEAHRGHFTQQGGEQDGGGQSFTRPEPK